MSENRKLYELKTTLNYEAEETASVTYMAFIEGTLNGDKEVDVANTDTGLAHRQCSNKDLFDACFAEIWGGKVCY